jgi:hypothetical protein
MRDNIEMYLVEIQCGNLDCIHLSESRLHRIVMIHRVS